MINKVERIIKLFSKDGDYMHIILLVCACAHVGYLALFYFLDIHELFIFNIFSVFSYVVICALSKRGKTQIAYVLTYLEIFLHQLYGMYVMGLDAGFDLLLCCLFLFQFSFFGKKTCFYLSVFLFCVIYGYFTLSDLGLLAGHNGSVVSVYAKYSDMLYYINEAVLISFIVVYAILASLVSSTNIDDLKYLVQHDMLTGLGNRKYLDEVVIAKLQERPMLLCICDIDDFKHINDTYGHDVGDGVLKRIGLLFGGASDDSDIDIVRWGGEEFLICGYVDGIEHAKELLDSLQIQLRQCYIRQLDGCVGMTFGAVYVDAPSKSQFERYFKLADEALYEGKTSGKGKIVLKNFS